MNDYELHNALLPGSWVNGKYQIANLLGHGGFGNTYQAYDMEYNKMVAIKELYPVSFVYLSLTKKNFEMRRRLCMNCAIIRRF